MTNPQSARNVEVATIIFQQLFRSSLPGKTTRGIMVVGSWGFREKYADNDEQGNPGLRFTVSGTKFQGKVRVLLINDEYTVQTYNPKKDTDWKLYYGGVYAENLLWVLDDLIEL